MWLSTQVRSLVGEIDIALKDVDGKSPENLVGMLPRRLSEERNRIAQHLDPAMVERELRARWAALDRSLDGDGQEWRRLFPGKIIVGRLCGEARIQKGYFTSLYIAAARRAGLEPFAEIIALFREWAGLASPPVAQNTE